MLLDREITQLSPGRNTVVAEMLQQPGQPDHCMPAPSNGAGMAGLTLGVAGVFSAGIPFFGFLMGLLAVAFGAVGLTQYGQGESTNPVASGFGVGLGLLAMLSWPLVFAAAAGTTA